MVENERPRNPSPTNHPHHARLRSRSNDETSAMSSGHYEWQECQHCDYRWLAGDDGRHNCTDVLNNKLKEQKARERKIKEDLNTAMLLIKRSMNDLG